MSSYIIEDAKNQPLLTIIITAYNYLEKYTKLCLYYLFKYTEGIEYELILLDNGSTDGTFEYFKQISHPNKKIIRVCKNARLCYGMAKALPYARGKYIAMIHNDVYITYQSLSLLLSCLESDSRIGCVVPMSNYVGSHQSIYLKYNTLLEMQEAAKKYNKLNPLSFQERLRIITIGSIFRRSCLEKVGGLDYGFLQDYSDNDLSFRIRRAGYKNIVCKDVFIYHAGTNNDKGQKLRYESMYMGRSYFSQKYDGIDLKTDCDKYEEPLIKLLDALYKSKEKDRQGNEQNAKKVLGIGVGCGTPLLEVKNTLRGYRITNVDLYAYSSSPRCIPDLQSITRTTFLPKTLQEIIDSEDLTAFDIVIIGQGIEEEGIAIEPIKSIIQKLMRGAILLTYIKGEAPLENSLREEVSYRLRPLPTNPKVYACCLVKK